MSQRRIGDTKAQEWRIDTLIHECRWIQDEDGVWQTACGGSYEIIEGTPRQNGMAFCCYCGSRLRYNVEDERMTHEPRREDEPSKPEILARLAIQSERYRDDEEFRVAVDDVLGHYPTDAHQQAMQGLQAELRQTIKNRDQIATQLNEYVFANERLQAEVDKWTRMASCAGFDKRGLLAVGEELTQRDKRIVELQWEVERIKKWIYHP